MAKPRFLAFDLGAESCGVPEVLGVGHQQNFWILLADQIGAAVGGAVVYHDNSGLQVRGVLSQAIQAAPQMKAGVPVYDADGESGLLHHLVPPAAQASA